MKNVPKLNTLWKFGFEEMSMGILLKNLNKKTPVISRCLFVLIGLIIFNCGRQLGNKSVCYLKKWKKTLNLKHKVLVIMLQLCYNSLVSIIGGRLT